MAGPVWHRRDRSQVSIKALADIGEPNALLGDPTGLGANSATLTVAQPPYSEALWQRSAFMVILATANLGADASKKIAANEDGHIPRGAAASTGPSAASESPSPTTLFMLSPEAGNTVSGTVQVDTSSTGATLTAAVSGLEPGHAYIADADPLPYELFVDGPSQSFPARLTADSSGRAKVSWSVPTDMTGSASVQALTNQGTYTVLACADLK